jgi:hypothetical protein
MQTIKIKYLGFKLNLTALSLRTSFVLLNLEVRQQHIWKDNTIRSSRKN